ncbi:MAG: hypothetical protein K9J06_10370 [Flavobacteriales bacterium]|nr:hypothetical protein [Flavobacteriales bacterium]
MRPLLLLLVVMLFGACSRYAAFEGAYRIIPTGPGPEDIALDTSLGHPRIVIACAQRRTDDQSQNGFRAYTIATGLQTNLVLQDLPRDVTLSPHGIDIATASDGTLLYAVNHDRVRNVHSILVFVLEADTLRFREMLTHPLLFSPNDVCTDHNGGIYVSNDSGKGNVAWEKLWSLRRSYVLHYDGNQWHQVGDRLAYANGVGVKDDRLFVTGTQEKSVLSYHITSEGLSERRDMPVIKGADNITFHEGTLVGVAHLDFLAFLRHKDHVEKKSPCAVYAMGLDGQRTDTLFIDNGHILSAASTGLIVGDSLYVAQVFDPFIIAVPLN